MYCSSCGAAIGQDLSYCNRCGAKSGETKSESLNKTGELFPDSLIWAIVSVFVVGLGCMIALMAMMKQLLNLDNQIILTVTLLGFLLMLVIESAFIWKLLRRKNVEKQASDAALPDAHATKELNAASERMLHEPLPSVTEHTTRSFEPLYRDRKSK
jgi:uncharacterized paraquat-inducible protein A